MENPLQYAIRRSGITPLELARNLYVSKQYISRVQKGCAVNLSPQMVRWIKETIHDDFEILTDEGIQNWFNVWKTCKRLSILSARGIELPNLYKSTEKIEVISLQDRGPLKLPTDRAISFIPNTYDKEAYLAWRKENWDTTYKFSSDMCITPAAVDIYERSTRNRPSPELIELFSWIVQYAPVANFNEAETEAKSQ